MQAATALTTARYLFSAVTYDRLNSINNIDLLNLAAPSIEGFWWLQKAMRRQY